VDTTEDRFLSPADVGEIFRVDPKTVYHWVAKGLLGCTRNGGSQQFLESKIRELAGSDPLLLPSEVAALFRVDSRTVNRWALARRLECIRIPSGSARFPEPEVRALQVRMGLIEPDDQ
jgi:predicted site-specific integrase-resolvase